MRVSIVTPWLNCPELLGQYMVATQMADEIIIIDNGGAPDMPAHFRVIRNTENKLFSAACNQGIEAATGDIIICLNNDILAAPNWIDLVRRDVQDNGLYGVNPEYRTIAGQPMTYLDGWCIAARRSTWQALNGWDSAFFPLYYSDVDLSYRAHRAGFPLRVRRWPIQHLSNYTSQRTPGAYADSDAAYARFIERVRAAQ